MPRTDGANLLKKIQNRLTAFISRNEKKSPVLEGINFLIDNYPLIDDNEKELDESDSDIEMLILGILPSATNIFTDDNFCKPLFMVQFLQKLIKVYGFDKVPDLILQEIQHLDLERENPILNTRMCFSSFILPHTEFVRTLIDRCRTGRGSVNLFIRNNLPENNYVKELSSVQDPDLLGHEKKTEQFSVTLPSIANNEEEWLPEKSSRL